MSPKPKRRGSTPPPPTADVVAVANSATAHSRDSRRRFWTTGVFACALTVGLVHVAALRAAPWFHVLLGDALSYDRWAREIAGGDWLGREVFYQAPLYPYFLGALYTFVGTDVLIVRLVQVLLGATAALLLALAVERLFDRKTGIVAGLMLAVYPPVVFSNGLVQKSALDIVIVCAALWLLARLMVGRDVRPDGEGRSKPDWQWLALGLVLGCLMLTRENAAVLVLAVLFWVFVAASFAGARLRLAGLLLAGVALILTPVAARNSLVGGELHLTTSQFGPNFYIGNRAGANGSYTSLRPRRGNALYERQDAIDIAEEATGHALSPAEVSTYFTNRAFSDIRSDPSGWLALLGRKTALLWNAVEIADSDDQYTAAEWSPLLRVLDAVWHMGVLGPLAVLGIVVSWPRRRLLWPLYVLIVAYGASVVLFYVFARYRLPIVPLLMIFAATSLVQLRGYTRVTPTPLLARTATLVAVFAVFCNWPLLRPDAMRATMHYNLGVVQMRASEPEDAVREFTLATTLHPSFAEAHNNLGIVLGQLSRFDEASAAFDRAVAVDPAFQQALNNGGEVLVRLGRRGEARERFERATSSDPDYAQAHANLGRLYAAEGALSQAEAAYRRVVALDPGSAGAHNDLAALLGRQGRMEEAARHSMRALEIDPRNVEAENNLAVVAATAGRFAEAAARLSRALAIEPGTPQTHYNLGTVLAQQGRFDEARAEFEATLRLDLGHVQARRNLEALRGRAVRPPAAPEAR